MTTHITTGRDEWLEARRDLLAAEKDLTRRSDEVARLRQRLPWVKIDKAYEFDTEAGVRTLEELFDGRSQLLVYHFMFGPDYKAGCLSCSSIADGFNGIVPHLMHHDVAFCAVSQAPLAKLQAYKERMGWSFPWASSYGSDFNYDFHVSETKEQQESGVAEYNFKREETKPVVEPPEGSSAGLFAAAAGVDYRTYTREGPGMSAFALEDVVVYHTYSAYARGVDALWGMYPWLDRAPLGRNEEAPGPWWRRHDEYD
jgi:predicted dithiol-disulfide oxidoreductase (DUF899 family)